MYLVLEDFDDGWCYEDGSGAYYSKLLSIWETKEQAIEYMKKQKDLLLSSGYVNPPFIKEEDKLIQVKPEDIHNCVAIAFYKNPETSYEYLQYCIESGFGEVIL